MARCGQCQLNEADGDYGICRTCGCESRIREKWRQIHEAKLAEEQIAPAGWYDQNPSQQPADDRGYCLDVGRGAASMACSTPFDAYEAGAEAIYDDYVANDAAVYDAYTVEVEKTEAACSSGGMPNGEADECAQDQAARMPVADMQELDDKLCAVLNCVAMRLEDFRKICPGIDSIWLDLLGIRSVLRGSNRFEAQTKQSAE